MTGLADQQAALVRALVAGGPNPDGFEADRLVATSAALLRKRADEVAGHDPMLAYACGENYRDMFITWAAGRPKTTTHDDAHAFAEYASSCGIAVRPRGLVRSKLRRVLR